MSSICEHSFKVLFRCVIYVKGQLRQLLLTTKILVSVYMIEFSVIFICVSQRCFLCMIVHDDVSWERESKKVCVFKCMCVCTRTHMCVCMNVHLHECQSVQGWNVTWLSVCTGVKCYSCPAPEYMKLMSCKFNWSS